MKTRDYDEPNGARARATRPPTPATAEECECSCKCLQASGALQCLRPAPVLRASGPSRADALAAAAGWGGGRQSRARTRSVARG
jgi:hypothetical protein